MKDLGKGKGFREGKGKVHTFPTGMNTGHFDREGKFYKIEQEGQIKHFILFMSKIYAKKLILLATGGHPLAP